MADMYEDAKKAMKRVLMVEKNNGEAYFHLGNIALLENDLDEAKQQYANAINNEFDIPQIYINLASVAEDDGDWEEAVTQYSKAIARDRFCYEAKIRRIEIYLAAESYSEALSSAQDLVETNPEIFEGHHFLFLILATQGKMAEAEKALEKAIKLFPDDQALFWTSKTFGDESEYENALSLLDHY